MNTKTARLVKKYARTLFPDDPHAPRRLKKKWRRVPGPKRNLLRQGMRRAIINAPEASPYDD